MADTRPIGARRAGRSRGLRVAAVVVLAGFLAGACTGGGSKESGVSIASHDPATTTSTSLPDTTLVPDSTTTTTTLPGIGPGAKGPVVAALESKLNSLHYEVGAVNDVYDQDTAYAVTAFQKVTGMSRTGRATDDVVAAVEAAKSIPTPLVPDGGANRVEVSLAKQVLYLYEGGALTKILTVATGNGARFCDGGWCRKAITNPGSFKVYRKVKGWETGSLGPLYNPQYFDGGIAIHGSQSVPASPASHGCVRIPMHAAEWFPTKVSLGTPVYVAGTDGSIPPPLPETTTTTPTTTPITIATTTTVAPTTTKPKPLGGLLSPP